MIHASMIMEPKRHAPHTSAFARKLGMPVNHAVDRMFLIRDVLHMNQLRQVASSHRKPAASMMSTRGWGLCRYSGQEKSFQTAEMLCKMHDPTHFRDTAKIDTETKSAEVEIQVHDLEVDRITNNLKSSISGLAFAK